MLARFFRFLKPGGAPGIVDQTAENGSPASTGNTLHRIDPALVRSEVEAAGFAFEGESDGLRNPDDDLTQNVFAPAVRGRTDRFVFRFRKPAG